MDKQLILECLGTRGFRDVFMLTVSKWAAIRWDGYRIARFFNASDKNFDECAFLDRQLFQVAKSLRFPKRPIHESALYFWLWRRYVKSGGMQCYPESPADGYLRPSFGDYQSGSEWCTDQWTLFYFMYLDSLTWNFPNVFAGCPDQESHPPRARYAYREVCRQLCGVRNDSARVFQSRTGAEGEYKTICAHCEKKYWAKRFEEVEKNPAMVLALSFYANGFASFKTNSNAKVRANEINAEYLYGLVDRATHYCVFMPEDDWEARALFFVLAQWLFLSDRKIEKPTLEEHIFAILYLRFYRQGADEYFKRGSMASVWDKIPYEAKEDMAARYRRLLADTRSEAARSWPEAKISDCPEGKENRCAVELVFGDLVRAGQYEKLEILIREHGGLLSSSVRRTELLWAASHSKKMYGHLAECLRLVQRKKSLIDDSKVDKADIQMVVDGWSKLAVEDLSWSHKAVKDLLPHEEFERLVDKASESLFLTLFYGDQVQMDRLRAYVEDLGLDVNAGKKEEYLYKTVLYNFISRHRIGREEAISYLLAHGADPNCGGHRCTSLMLAVAYNDLGLMRQLIDAGADVNLPSTTERTPMQVAIEHNHTEALEMLIKFGASNSRADAE